MSGTISQMKPSTWVIMGASSAVGRAFANIVASQGCGVVVAGRDEEDLLATAEDLKIKYGVQVCAKVLDVTQASQYQSFINDCQMMTEDRQLHLFICCGMMLEQSQASDRVQMYQANYTGVAELLMHFKSLFQRQCSGRIIVLGSVAGDRGRRSNYIYGSAKAGLHAFLQGYRSELSQSGVMVTTIKPGFIDTSMTFGLPGLFAVASPRQCAAFCFRQSQSKRLVCYYPRFWLLIMTVIKLIPECVMKRLTI